MWPDRRLLDLFQIDHPIVLAPMAGAMDFEHASALGRALPAGEVTRKLAAEALALLRPG